MSRPKSSKKYDAILDAAKLLFFKYGFSDVSVDMIRDKAEVSKNTIYNHFKDKKDLFEAVIVDHWQSESSPRITYEPGDDLDEVLTTFAKALLKHLHGKHTKALFRILVAEAERFPGLAQAIVKQNKPPILLHFMQFLQQAYKLDEQQATQAAIYFFGLLKEDAFWHVLAGLRKPYTQKEIDAHVQQVVAAFRTMMQQL